MDRENQLESKLRLFSSNFNIIEDVQKLSQQHVTMKRNKLIGDSNSIPFDTDMEICRIWNLISFLCYMLNDTKLAFEYNAKVIERCKDNMTALSNKAWLYLKEKERYKDVEKCCELLGHMNQSEWNVLVAKAETAYSLTKLGIQYFCRASQIYRSILERCKLSGVQGETGILKYEEAHQEEVSQWIFDFALTEKRLLNLHNTNDESFSNITIKKHIDVSELFVRIIQMKSEQQSIKRLKARAYVELGSLVHLAERNSILFPSGINDLLPGHEDLWLTAENFFIKALDIFYEDFFVLERSGKHFRYANKLERSVTLLEKAIQIKETSFGHHHLALSLKRQLEMSGGIGHGLTDAQNVKKNLFGLYNQNTNTTISTRNDMETTGPIVVKCDGNDVSPAIFSQYKFINEIEDKGSLKSVDSETMSFDQGQRNSPNTSNPDERSYGVHKEKLSEDSSEEKQNSMSVCSNCESTNKSANSQPSEGFIQFLREPVSTEQGRPLLSMSGADDSVCRKDTEFISRSDSLDENYKSDFSKKQTAIKLVIKSPRKLPYIDKNKDIKTFQRIIHHLDRSVELTENCGALYDKGLLFRATGDTQKALDVFKQMVKNKNQQCSPIQLSNAYEQAGLCLYDMILNNEDKTDIELLEGDMKMYRKHSIEISCRIVGKIPFLKDCWVSAPTLRNLLLGKANTKEREKERLADLAFLHKKLEQYRDAIEILKQLSELADNDAEKSEVWLDIVQSYKMAGQYDDAVCAMSLITCLPNGYSLINETLFLEVYVYGGISALKRENHDIARARFLQLLDFSWNANREHVHVENADDSSANYDIFILCNKDNEANGVNLMKVFKLFAFKTTVNNHSALPGSMELRGIETAVKCCKHVILVYDVDREMTTSVDELEMRFSMVQEILKERGHGNIVIVTDKSTFTLPTTMSVFKTVQFEFKEDIEIGKELINNDIVCETVKEILWQLMKK